MRNRIAAVLAAVLMLLGIPPFVAAAKAAPEFRALLFTKTAGYRHDSIPNGVAMFQQLAAANNFEVVHTEDSAVFNDADLAGYDVVIMFQTSGMVWENDAQRAAMQTYVRDEIGRAHV